MRATTMRWWGALVALGLLGMATTVAARPKTRKQVDFIGADATGRLCLQTPKGDGPEWRIVALEFTGKKLAGDEVKECPRQLKRGLPDGATLLLYSRKPKGRVALPVSATDEEVAVSTLPNDRKEAWFRKAARLLRTGRGLSLKLRSKRRSVTVARLRRDPEGVQYIRLRLQHDPESHAVAFHSYTFFGTGLSVGPSQRHHAVFAPKTGKGRIVREQFIAEDCPHPKRCGHKPRGKGGLDDFFKPKQK